MGKRALLFSQSAIDIKGDNRTGINAPNISDAKKLNGAKNKEKQMNKLMMGLLLGLVGMSMIGCHTTVEGTNLEARITTDGTKDRIIKWKEGRAPVEVIKSKIEPNGDPDLAALKLGIETLDVAPYALYLGSTKLLDLCAFGLDANIEIQNSLAYYNGAIKEGKTHEEAIKIAHDRIKKESMDGVFDRMKEYKGSFLETTLPKIQEELPALQAKYELVQATVDKDGKQLTAKANAIANRLGMMEKTRVISQATSDIAAVTAQVTDASIALGFCSELLGRFVADKALLATTATINATTAAGAAVANMTNAAIIDAICMVEQTEDTHDTDR